MINPFVAICDRLQAHQYLPAAADELKRMSQESYQQLFTSLTQHERKLFEEYRQRAESASKKYVELSNKDDKETVFTCLQRIREIKQLHDLFESNLGGSPEYCRENCLKNTSDADKSDILAKALSLRDEIRCNIRRMYLVQTLAKIPSDTRDSALPHIAYILKNSPERQLPLTFIAGVEPAQLAAYLQNLHTLLLNAPTNQWQAVNELLTSSTNKSKLLTWAASIMPRLEEQDGPVVLQVLRTIMVTPNIENILADVSSLTQMCQRNPHDHIVDIINWLSQLSDEERIDCATRCRRMMQDINTGCFISQTLRALIDTPAARRDHLRFRIHDNHASNQMDIDDLLERLGQLFFHGHPPQMQRHQKPYKLQVGRADVEEQPIATLARVVELFKQDARHFLRVQLLREDARDVGGVAQDVLATIVRNGCIQTKMARCSSSGLFRPCSEKLSCEEEAFLSNLGQLFMFCLNATEEYLVGYELDLSLFHAVKLLQQKHIDTPIDTLLQDDKEFSELFTILTTMNSEHADDINKINVMRKMGKQELVLDTMKAALLPCIAIKKGMLESRFAKNALENLSAVALSEKLQGRLTSNILLDKLHFNPEIPKHPREWITSWIKKLSYEQLQDFLYAVTGVRSIGKKVIRVEPSSDKDPHLHTCFNQIDLPLATITSEEQMHKILKYCVKFGKTYTTI